jgi:hypothetical protein
MNKIIRQNYPAANLPEDLREGIDLSAQVTVTVIADERPRRTRTLEEIWQSSRPKYSSAEEIVAQIRKMRDEEDD